MNKSQLVDALAAKHGLPVKKVQRTVDAIFEMLTKALEAGERIELRGFGSFVVNHYDGYTGRNPKTGEAIEVRSKKLPFFRVGKELRERIGR